MNAHGVDADTIVADLADERVAKRRYGKLFSLPSHRVYALIDDGQAIHMENWDTFCTFAAQHAHHIEAVLAVPNNIATQLEMELA